MPFPPADGGAQATYYTTIGLLANNVEVTVIAINPSRNRVDLAAIPPAIREQTRLVAVDVDTAIRPLGILLNLFSKESYFTERFHSHDFSERLKDLLRKECFDIVQFEHVYMCIYLEIVRKLSSAKVTLRPQNVEHVIWQRYLTGLTNPLKRFFISYSVKRLKRFEETMAEKVDAIIPLTENDAAIFRPHANRAVVSVVPMGYNLDKLAGYDYNKQYAANPSFYHLASMDWLPNVEAVEWFFNEVAERIIGMHAEIRIHIAGRKMPDRFLRKADKNLIVEPAVEDPVHWQEDKTVMIVPLHSGSGIRAKIIEGLALGKTIISTTTGAQGIACTANENILIADTPEAFANQMSKCFLSIALCKQLGNNAKKLSSEKYEYKSCAAKMMKIYQRSGNFHS